jgi:holo-[acyl-carrier protein] synthase
MGLRVGIDLVSVQAVRESIRDHGDRYLERVYTKRELEDCRTVDGIAAERLAGRFAAKEAAKKVLRPDEEALGWSEIEVVRHATGWVELELGGVAAALARSQGLDGFALSIAHEHGYATAVVVAEMAGVLCR